MHNCNFCQMLILIICGVKRLLKYNCGMENNLTIKEILLRIGYVRNLKNLSARELSLRIGMSENYVGKVESQDINLSMQILLKILDVCEFPIERFFSKNIATYDEDKELEELLASMSAEKKKSMIDFIKKD